MFLLAPLSVKRKVCTVCVPGPTTVFWAKEPARNELSDGTKPSAGPSEALCEAAEIASGRDAPAHLCSRAERRGARPARSGPARPGRVHRAPGADRAGERGRAPAADDRARAALRRADGPQRRPRLQRRRPRGPDGRLVAAEERRPGPGRGRAGAAPGDPAPAAARLRPRQEHLDPRPPGAGGARARTEPDRALGGDGPAGAAAARRGLEAGQALADQPRPRLRAKKRRRDRLIRLARGRPGWALGFADEVWFSRLAQPALHAWTAGEPLRLGTHAAGRDDPEPKALACYGLWLPERERMMLRFVAGRPVSGITCAFLAWVAGRLAVAGVRVLVLIWDNAPWHVSREVRAWIAAHNRRVKAVGRGCRLLVCRLPSKSPWLNPIEPRWAHGKRAVVEPDRKLTGQELRQRLCDHYRCPLVEPLAQQAA